MSRHHRLTPEAYKLIEQLAKTLPPLQRISDQGKPLSRQLTKQVKGSEVPMNRRPDIKNFDPSKNYLVRYWEPLHVNHAVNLRAQYEKAGMAGVEAYRDKVMSIVNKAIEEKEEKNV